MKNLYIILFLVCGKLGFAHEANEAFFTFEIKDDLITVEAELPWSMRNALISYNPKLETSTNQEDFENTFFEYIKRNLILKNKNGVILEFLQFEELENSGHSHQNNYLLTYQGNDVFEVTNTIMFNVYNNQVNFNRITSSNKTFKTSNKKKSFQLHEEKSLGLIQKGWWLFLIPLAIVILLFILKKTKIA